MEHSSPFHVPPPDGEYYVFRDPVHNLIEIDNELEGKFLRAANSDTRASAAAANQTKRVELICLCRPGRLTLLALFGSIPHSPEAYPLSL